MNIYAYIVPVDDGAAPNPYGDICTLAICKPNLRKIAKVDDWIIGLNSECKLIYAMKITTVQTMKEYDSFTKDHLKIKIPNKHSKNIQEQMGDSVYDFKVCDRLVLEKELEGFTVDLKTIYFQGTCPKCQDK